jgi:hypothetical protein
LPSGSLIGQSQRSNGNDVSGADRFQKQKLGSELEQGASGFGNDDETPVIKTNIGFDLPIMSGFEWMDPIPKK